MRLPVLLISGAWFYWLVDGAGAAETVTVHNCLLALDAEATVPAQEPGVLMKIPVAKASR